MNRIKKYVGDPRFIEIINNFFKAGYLDPKTGKIVL